MISVVINTYNAERHLEEVLQSVEGFDEVLVCDMESTDRTLEIARRHGCRIVTFPKGNHLSAEPARTFAIQQATHPWVLVVDADELVTPQLRDYLYRKIQQPDCPQGLYIPRRNRIMNQLERGRLRDHQLRFFIREGTTWPPFVHTFPQVNGRVERMKDGTDETILVHLDENYMHDRIEKLNRYSDNEVEKQAGRHYGVAALFYRPLWRFFKSYVMDQGYKNGVAGLINSMNVGLYQFLIVAKIIEKRITAPETAGGKDESSR